MLTVAGSTVTAPQAPFSTQPALSAAQPRQDSVPPPQQRLTAPAVHPSSLALPLQTAKPAITAADTAATAANTAAAAAPMPGQLGNCITTGAPKMSMACAAPPRTCDSLTLAPAAAIQAAVAPSNNTELEVDDLIPSLPQVWCSIATYNLVLDKLCVSCPLAMFYGTMSPELCLSCMQIDWQIGNIF